MANKTTVQAEAELRAAALAYVAADRKYRDVYQSSGQVYEQPLNAETDAACKESNRTLHAMERAAWDLALASGFISDEQARINFFDGDDLRAEGV